MGIPTSLVLIGSLILVLALAAAPAGPSTQPSASPLDFTVKDIDGNDVNLANYKGKVVLIVNVASKCGFTPQYEGLEALYRKYQDKGLVVIGFPANDFKNQEPGTDEQIKQFCAEKYGVTFPMMAKITVLGEDKHPVYKTLTESSTAGENAGEIGWNFTKFLIGRDGKVLVRFNSKIKPDDAALVEAVEKALAGN